MMLCMASNGGEASRQSTAASGSVGENALSDAMKVVWQIPLGWIALMVLFAVLTSINITRDDDGRYLVTSVHVGALALISLALVWLPPLLRLFLLTGGSVRAGGMEAAAEGLFTREQLLTLLTRAKAVTTTRGDDANAAIAIADLDAEIDRLAFDSFDSNAALSPDALHALAVKYERLRRDAPSGPQRTSAMTKIVNEARVRAATSAARATSQALQLLSSTSQGNRIVGLALTQEAAPPLAFPLVLRLIQRSATAFEMFHALLALQEIIPGLDETERSVALIALEAELKDPRDVGVLQDPGLPTLLKRTLLQLRTASRPG